MAGGGARRPGGALLAVVVGQGLASATSFVTALLLGRWAGLDSLGAYALGWSGWFLVWSLGDTLVATPYTYAQARAQAPGAGAGAGAGLAPAPATAPSGRAADGRGAADQAMAAADLPMAAPDLVMAAAWGVAGLCAVPTLGLAALWCWAPATGGLATVAGLWPALPVALCACAARELARRHWLLGGGGAAGGPRGGSGRVLRADALGALLQLGGAGLLAWQQRLDAPAMFWVVAAAAAAPVLPLATPARLRRWWAARRAAPGVLRGFVAYGRWLLAGGLCHVASVQAYPWLAQALAGTRGAGLWAACSTLANLLSPLLTALSNHFRPRFMQAFQQRPWPAFEAAWRRTWPLFVLPALAWWLAALLVGPAMLSASYGAGYAAGAGALTGLAAAALAVAVAAPLQLALLAMHAPASNLAYHGSGLALLGLAVLAHASGAPAPLQALRHALPALGPAAAAGGLWPAASAALADPLATPLAALGALAAGANLLATALLWGLYRRRRARALAAS